MSLPHEKVRQIVHRNVIRPVARFIESQASGGIILLACTVIALVWANSPYGDTYQHLWETEVSVQFGGPAFSLPLHAWINDALMALFFLLVGLEIKREILVGELSTLKNASLPIMAALGGMVVPALIYFGINRGGEGSSGWAVPMATDIAFSLGILALLGKRAPLSLKVFLTALAIVDDLGAVIVIALFYSGSLNMGALQTAGLLFLILVLLNAVGVRNLVPYMVVGVGLWLALLSSGIHATIAGVVLALTIPTRVRMNADEFLDKGRDLLKRFEEGRTTDESNALLSEERQNALHAIEKSCEGVQMPLQRLEHNLHTPVNYLIMPLFALANAGVVLHGVGFGQLSEHVTLGIVLGLLIGKVVGIS
ncbi:MAG TPA: Na+/H+ antiporter NhaA, partial [Fimbriimonadaceae bacterium]|nr:Na+/H+ antiporter NhaA [Fimbriimonadaceae bacterium]